MVEWAHRFGCRVHLHAADRHWIVRPDPALELWSGETLALGDGLTLIRGGGHFAGGTLLHWEAGAGGAGALLSGDIVQVIPDRRHVGFMYSYPNLIPLPAATVDGIVAALEAVRVRADLRRVVGRDRPARRQSGAAALGRALRARPARRPSRRRLIARFTPCPQERDLFANFERMRREMDELFSDVLERRLTPRRHDGFMPPSTSTTRANRRARSCAPTSRASTPPTSSSRSAGASSCSPGQRATDRPIATNGSTSSSRSSTARSGASSRSAPRSTPTPPARLRARHAAGRAAAARPARRSHGPDRAAHMIEIESPSAGGQEVRLGGAAVPPGCRSCRCATR